MRIRNVFRSAIACMMAASMLLVSLPVAPAAAGMISTDQVIGETSAQEARRLVGDFLARGDVRQQMEALGVDPGEAAARVDSLSTAELEQLAGRIDQMPAGEGAGTTILGVFLAVLVVLIFTDLFGWTNVYSFITPMQ